MQILNSKVHCFVYFLLYSMICWHLFVSTQKCRQKILFMAREVFFHLVEYFLQNKYKKKLYTL